MPRARNPTARPPGSARANGAPWPVTRERIRTLAHNLWWSWNPAARRLFESMDPTLWRANSHNPIATLNNLSSSRAQTLSSDPDFLSALAAAEHALEAYLASKTWFSSRKRQLTAYFCMEFGIHESLPLYAGGLGILAGDHIKSASDLGVPLVGVGILWKFGYYRQELTKLGETRVVYPAPDFSQLPIESTGKFISLPVGRQTVRCRIWRLTVGRVPVFLLDSDLPTNSPTARALTHHLYRGGDPDYRIRQEILLGIGGMHALDALGLSPTVYHLNEGHAAFAPLERLRRLVAGGKRFGHALNEVRRRSVFTTHTPVPEGNDRFDPALVMKYLGRMPNQMRLNASEFLAFGREDQTDQKESFCMTVLALRLSARSNGVSRLHAETSRRMWKRVFAAARAEEVPIGSVTNGVHPESWIADEARPFYDLYFKPRWNGADPEDDWWKGVGRVPKEELWTLRQTLRKRMISWLRQRSADEATAFNFEEKYAARLLAEVCATLDENALTIGFARRFATYKRAPLIFTDPKRLARLVRNTDRPVQFVFAGKAHPQDRGGQEFVRTLHEFSLTPEFRGRVLLIQNYDMHVGRMLTSGCDVWLNNPVRPMEASGTSGMKSPLNLGINCSILDGWWPEAFNRKNGWVIGGKQFADRKRQDRYDADALYATLEDQVIPLFYRRDRRGVPGAWCRMMAESMRSVCAEFSSHRMVADYARRFYAGAK
ncbi:MAG: alpha-glucan family phosphorylase [Phycisphaerae bacterium]|nr:alpha-glucan family phosphorylase [Phycisphaerae bacterium]